MSTENIQPKTFYSLKETRNKNSQHKRDKENALSREMAFIDSKDLWISKSLYSNICFFLLFGSILWGVLLWGEHGFKTFFSFFVSSLMFMVGVASLCHKNRWLLWKLFIRYWRWYYLPVSMISIAIVAGLATEICSLSPIFRYGWWSFFGGQGSIATASILHPLGIMAYMPYLIISTMFFSLPYFAYGEEVDYRKGLEKHNLFHRFKRSVVFGLTHLTMGIPLGVAIALIFGGFVFTGCYLLHIRQIKKEHKKINYVIEKHCQHRATLHAMALHANYNIIAFLMIAGFLAFHKFH
jgi:hypothetical protein